MARTDFHEDFGREPDVGRGSDRSFGVVFTAVFVIVGLSPLLGGGGARIWSLAAAGAILSITLLAPRLLSPLNRLWFRFGLLLHKVVSPIILALLFFGTVTPIAFVMRLAGKDPLRVRLEPEARTYWIDRRPPGPSPQSMRDQF